MPMYEYLCLDCEAITEKLRKLSEIKKQCSCAACGSYETLHIISATTFRLKGHGWYETTYNMENRTCVATDDRGIFKQ